MALDYQRGESALPQARPFVIAVLLVIAALFLGAALAYLVVPFEPDSWSALMARIRL